MVEAGIHETLSGLTRVEQVQHIESRERVTTTHAEIMQAARNLHDEIRAALCRQTQNVFDNATSFHPGQHVFDDHAGAGEETIEEPGLYTQLLAFRFFWGCRVSTPAGS